LRNSDLAADICQEAFARAFEKLDQFDVDREFGPWLMKIAVNLVREHFRKLGQGMSLTPIDEQLMTSPFPEPGDQVVGRMILDECLEQLPLVYRIMFALRHGVRFSYEEIAQILDEPLGTVKVNLYRARELLKRFLTREAQESSCDGVKVR
jgi:RNA polymerase sigma-70 factor (ECF subfamily)